MNTNCDDQSVDALIIKFRVKTMINRLIFFLDFMMSKKIAEEKKT